MTRHRVARRLIRQIKAGSALLAGALAIPLAWLRNTPARDPLDFAIGQMLMLGFYGHSTNAISARLLAAQLRAGRAGGVFFVLQNIGSRDEVGSLIALFRAGCDPLLAPLLAIDHEGGVVQRLHAAHGFTPLPPAREVAASMTPDQAKALYARAGGELAALGFDINLAPVVDIDVPDNPAIGRHGRSFGGLGQIAAYASAFLEGFAEAGILCAAKHFPGHGHAQDDSHDGAADISALWTPAELAPFESLIRKGQPMMVMGGHLRLRALEPGGAAATLSRRIVTDLLRRKLNFTGVILTDDLDMGAVSGTMTRREAVIQAIAAGNDLLLIKNLFGYDPSLPRHITAWVRQAILEGRLSEARIMESASRIRAARHLSHPPVPNRPR